MSSPDFFTDPTQITSQWLTECLQENGHLDQGEVVSIHVKKGQLATNPEASPRIKRLEINYLPGTFQSSPRNLIFKFFGKASSSAVREGVFYKEIAPAMSDPPVPPCYTVAIDNESQRACIIIKDLSTTHSLTIPSGYATIRSAWEGWAADIENKNAFFTFSRLKKTQFKAIIEAYLKVHICWWEHSLINQKEFLEPRGNILDIVRQATLPEVIHKHCRHVAEKDLPQFVDQFSNQPPGEWIKLCEKAIGSWAELYIQRTSKGKSLTLIHNDVHLWNILLPHKPQHDQPIIIDWEGYSRGIGLWDLSQLLFSCMLPSDTRQEFETALLPWYHDGLIEYGIDGYSMDDCHYDYRLSLIAHIIHILDWKSFPRFESAMDAFKNWDCEELLH